MAGEEVLIADGVAADRAGLVALVEQRGLVPSAVDSAPLARERLSGKFFAVALIDLDLPGGGGADVVEFARERSRATQVVALTSRRNFDGAVQAFRGGAVDVVFKRPDEAARLERALEVALRRYRSSEGMDVATVTDALDELTRLVVALGRQVYAGEIDSLTEVARAALQVLFVDDDTAFLQSLSLLVARLPMDAAVEMSGGGALDKLGVHRFDVLIVKDGLSDLPGSIVVNAAQQRNPECVALLYSFPGPGGRIDRLAEGRVVDTFTPFTGPAHLAERVRLLIEEEHARRRERKVLQVLRHKHADALRRYADAKRLLEGLRR